MKNIKYILFLIVLISNITYSAIAYITVDGSGTMDGTSWVNSLPGDSIQFALNDFWNDEIWIAKGVYKPTWLAESTTDERNKRFNITNNSTIFGGFAGTEIDISQRNIEENETIFSGDIGVEGDNSDNCYHVVWNSSTIIDGITIQDGNADGNGKFNYNNCGGAIITEDLPYTFRNCTFRNNYASDRGGAVASISNYRWSITFENCLFYDNESETGGAIYSSGKSIALTNCTIVNNTADEGGGIYLEYIGGTLTNNIIWGNTPNQIYEHDAFGMSYCFNAIEGGYNGFENIDLSPENTGFKNSPFFTDPKNNDFTLRPPSRCIDAGVFWNALDIDITNTPTPKGKCRDIGAYEYDYGALSTELPTVLNEGATVTSTTAILRGNITDNGDTQIVAKGVKYSKTSGFDPLTEGTLIRSIGLLDTSKFEVLVPNLEPICCFRF